MKMWYVVCLEIAKITANEKIYHTRINFKLLYHEITIFKSSHTFKNLNLPRFFKEDKKNLINPPHFSFSFEQKNWGNVNIFRVRK